MARASRASRSCARASRAGRRGPSGSRKLLLERGDEPMPHALRTAADVRGPFDAPRKPGTSGRRARSVGALRSLHRCDLRLPGRRARPAASATSTRSSQIVHPGFWPDLTVLLDAPVDTGLARAHERNGVDGPDRFETERREFFERVREAYLVRASREPQRLMVVDATGSVDAVEPAHPGADRSAPRGQADDRGGRQQSAAADDAALAWVGPCVASRRPSRATACLMRCCCTVRPASARSGSRRRWPPRCSARTADPALVACGECADCALSRAGSHPDLHWLRRLEDKKSISRGPGARRLRAARA